MSITLRMVKGAEDRIPEPWLCSSPELPILSQHSKRQSRLEAPQLANIRGGNITILLSPLLAPDMVEH
ncbi:hypothetical protein llap_16667 [Limosa lapponica baueri]|uniref:Uncharacterized protein n=1 Tax=Limosa lapponica baueri TaxID=1758121 RepID=A0A2I0TGV2_LIMLA|nr:hypothetical protein llap_16667 [Limosa lapponica baueri]